MFRKYSIAALLAGLAVLVGVYFLIDYTRSDDRTFKSQILDIDPDAVTRVVVNDAQTGEHVDMVMEDGKWLLYSDERTYNGAPEAIANAMAMLGQLRTESVAATKSDKWADFQLSEELAIHVEIYEGNKLTGDLYLGKFDFKQMPSAQPGRQPETKITSYVRSGDDDKVYAVNGLLKSNFQGGPSPFRNRNVFACNQHSDISRVNITGPEGQVVLENNGGQWLVNGVAADSAKTDRYLRGLSRLRSSTFEDDASISGLSPVYSMEIEGSSFVPAIINAYPADSTVMYYITSSENPGTIFNGAKGKVFEKAFVGVEAFLAENGGQ